LEWVSDMAFGAEGVIVTVAAKAKKPVCSGCGARGLSIKEHRVKGWRHLDLGGVRCRIECRLRRLYCPGDTGRLDGLVFIGVDEVSHGAERQFLTCVADHRRPRIVASTPGLCLRIVRASLTNGFSRERDAHASHASSRSGASSLGSR
jgi:zinc-finger of transposase IS204/IS1001/IS1096/IS1165